MSIVNINTGFYKKYKKKSNNIFLLLLISSISFGFIKSENKPVIIENEKTILIYHLKGGILKNFQLKNNSINPFQNSNEALMTYGQFPKIIFSAITKKNYLHESCQKSLWELSDSPIIRGQNIEMMMKSDFPEENISLKRFISFPVRSSLIEVTEEVYNYNKKDTEMDLEQHFSLNPELLSNAIIYSNLSVNVSKNIITRQIQAVDSGKGVLIISNISKNFFIGYTFEKESYSQIHFQSSAYPEIILSGDSKKVVKSDAFFIKKYTSFVGNLGKDFKEFNRISRSGNSIVIEANRGEIKFEFGTSSYLK